MAIPLSPPRQRVDPEKLRTETMRILFWLAVCLVGAFMSLGEFAYVKYWAGETVAEAVLFDDGQSQTYQIDVSEKRSPH